MYITFFFGNFKAMKIHPISKDLATPTDLSITGSLCDVIRGLSVDMSTGETFILTTFKFLQKLENDVSQML